MSTETAGASRSRGLVARAAERNMSGPCSITASTSGTVGSRCPASRSSSRSMARPRTTSSALLTGPPRPHVAPQPLLVGAADPAQRGTEWPGVERVDGAQAAAGPDHLPAQVLDEGGVVGFGVAEDQRAGAARDRA